MTRCVPMGVALLLTACAVGPDHAMPDREDPNDWRYELERGVTTEPADLTRWWDRLGDPLLTRLVDEAVVRNPGLASAASRVREARYRRAVATGDLGPTVDANGSFERSKRSQNEIFNFISGEQDLWSAGFDATWELDLFGGVRRGMEAADAEVGVRVEDYRDVLVSLIAEIARNYVELRGAQRQLVIAQENARAQRETVELTRSRFEAGLTNALDAVRARTNLASTEALIPPLRARVTAAEGRIAVLLGVDPVELGGIVPTLADDAPIPVAPATIAVGVPADLLRQRPDVRRAERQVAAAAARIGVATAELYPKFAITGSIGLSSKDAENLFEGDSVRYAWGPGFSWNVFASGRVLANVHALEEVHVQTLLGYQQTVLGAFDETRNALATFMRQQDRRDRLVDGEASARDAVELARELYTQGVADFEGVLDAERTLFSLQEQLAISERELAAGLIALYKSLGGGWETLAPSVEDEAGAPIASGTAAAGAGD